MKIKKYLLILCFGAFLLSFQSCQDDDSSVEEQEVIVDDFSLKHVGGCNAAGAECTFKEINTGEEYSLIFNLTVSKDYIEGTNFNVSVNTDNTNPFIIKLNEEPISLNNKVAFGSGEIQLDTNEEFGYYQATIDFSTEVEGSYDFKFIFETSNGSQIEYDYRLIAKVEM